MPNSPTISPRSMKAAFETPGAYPTSTKKSLLNNKPGEAKKAKTNIQTLEQFEKKLEQLNYNLVLFAETYDLFTSLKLLILNNDIALKKIKNIFTEKKLSLMTLNTNVTNASTMLFSNLKNLLSPSEMVTLLFNSEYRNDRFFKINLTKHQLSNLSAHQVLLQMAAEHKNSAISIWSTLKDMPINEQEKLKFLAACLDAITYPVLNAEFKNYCHEHNINFNALRHDIITACHVANIDIALVELHIQNETRERIRENRGSAFKAM